MAAVVAVLSVVPRLHPIWSLGAGAVFGLLGMGVGSGLNGCCTELVW